MAKPRKKLIRFTKEIKQFICGQVASGLEVAEVCRQFAEKVPTEEAINREQVKDKEFGADMDDAYTALLMKRLGELRKYSTCLASEIYPGVDFREAEAALKRRIDALKFALGKMAPIMSKRFDKVQRVEHVGDIQQTISVIKYHAPTPKTIPGIVVEQLENDKD